MVSITDQAKELFWRKELNCAVEPSFYKYIDRFYPVTWNKDLVSYIILKFSLKVTTAQLRAYARKFGLVKNIDPEQKAKMLLQRNNPDSNSKNIEEALFFLKEQAKFLANRQVLAVLSRDFGLNINYDQLTGKINRWLGIKKTAKAIACGRENTMSALSKYYAEKHKDFTRALFSYNGALAVIIASLLGDAELSPVKRGYAVFRDHHCANQRHWLKFKTNFLPPEPYFRLITYSDGSLSLTSQSNPFFSELQNHFYKEPSAELLKLEPRKKREKHLGPEAVELVRSVFTNYPWLALAVLIGDDGTLSASTRGKTVTFEYIIYSQGLSEETGHKLKQIIEQTTGLRLSTTKSAGEYGVRLTIAGMDQIQKVSEMISPYLSQVEVASFWKKYDLARHARELSKKHNKELIMSQPVNHWTEEELKIINDGIKNNWRPVEMHRRLLSAGFERTYFAVYSKWKEEKIHIENRP